MASLSADCARCLRGPVGVAEARAVEGPVTQKSRTPSKKEEAAALQLAKLGRCKGASFLFKCTVAKPSVAPAVAAFLMDTGVADIAEMTKAEYADFKFVFHVDLQGEMQAVLALHEEQNAAAFNAADSDKMAARGAKRQEAEQRANEKLKLEANIGEWLQEERADAQRVNERMPFGLAELGEEQEEEQGEDEGGSVNNSPEKESPNMSGSPARHPEQDYTDGELSDGSGYESDDPRHVAFMRKCRDIRSEPTKLEDRFE